MIKAVIFDLDGTLIDTEKLYRKFWPMAMAAHGYHLSDERTLEIRSLGRPFAPIQYKEWFGDQFDYYAVRDTRKKFFNEYVEKYGIEAKSGAAELVKKLREKNIITAIATATDIERTEEYLKMTGLNDLFDKKVSATMVERGKPAPDVYLYACEQIGMKPEECLAVEDAPNGVKSACAAGLKCVMVPDQTEPDDELKKILYATVPNLLGVEAIVDELNRIQK